MGLDADAQLLGVEHGRTVAVWHSVLVPELSGGTARPRTGQIATLYRASDGAPNLVRMATHPAHDIAAEIRKRIPAVPVKKLHKLLYYCQGHHAATFQQPLFAEAISAWDMGPVVGQLWSEEKQSDAFQSPDSSPLDEAELNTIGYVISRYGKLSGLDLEHLTHNELPWLDADKARREAGARSVKIPLAALQDFFGRDTEATEEATEPSLDPNEVKAWLEGAQDRSSDTLSEDTPESILARL